MQPISVKGGEKLYRILVVARFAELIRNYIRSRFSNIFVSYASTEASGIELWQRSLADSIPYQMVIITCWPDDCPPAELIRILIDANPEVKIVGLAYIEEEKESLVQHSKSIHVLGPVTTKDGVMELLNTLLTEILETGRRSREEE